MKKLIATAVMAVMATAAQAQNVTVYGIIDTAVQNYSNGTDRYTRSADGVLNTSRFGVRGSEDLGGGLKANFQLEALLGPSQGTLGSTTATETFNREAWVGLSGGFGEIRVGRQDVTFAQNIDSGASQAGDFALRAVNGGTNVELGTDQKNVIKYISPAIGGLTVQLGHASGNAAGATTDAQAEQNGISLDYRVGKARLMAGYQKNGGATTAAERDFTVYGVSYDFGFVSAGFTYGEGDVSTTGDVKNKTTTTSVKVPLGKGVAAHAVYSTAKDGSKSSDGEGSGYTLALTKELSKRTTVYAAYTAVDNEANSKMSMNTTTAPATAGLDPKAVTVGISHVF